MMKTPQIIAGVLVGLMLVGCDKSPREGQAPSKTESEAKATNVVKLLETAKEKTLEALAGGPVEKAHKKAAGISVRALDNAVVVYSLSHRGRLPQSLSELVEGDRPILQGGKEALVDPWDNPYLLMKQGRRRYYVMSCGPDGVEGTDDDIRSNPSEPRP